jgi:hypothetical protein
MVGDTGFEPGDAGGFGHDRVTGVVAGLVQTQMDAGGRSRMSHP